MDLSATTQLNGLDYWLEPRRKLVWESIYLGRREDCMDRLAAARAALDEIPQHLDKPAAELFIEFLEFQAHESFEQNPDQRRANRLKAIEHLSRPLVSRAGKIMQARILLTLRCITHHQGMAELAEDEVEELLGAIPEDDLDHQCLSYLAFWAYDTGNTRYLDYCFRQFLTDPFTFMVDFSRQRIKVMRALVNKNCDLEDISRLIELVPHQSHWDWVAEQIKPQCLLQNIWPAGVEQAFLQRKKQLEAEGPKVPHSSQPVSFQVNF